MVRYVGAHILKDGEVRVRLINGVPVALIRRGDEFVSYVAVCTHKYYVLCARRVEGNLLVCPAHEEKFNIDAGEPAVGKGREPLIRLRTEVRGGNVYIEKPSIDILEKLVKLTEAPP